MRCWRIWKRLPPVARRLNLDYAIDEMLDEYEQDDITGIFQGLRNIDLAGCAG